MINTTLASIVMNDYPTAYDGQYDVDLTLFNLAPEGWSSGSKAEGPSRRNVVETIVNQPTQAQLFGVGLQQSLYSKK